MISTVLNSERQLELAGDLLDIFGNRFDYFFTQWSDEEKGLFGYKKVESVALSPKIIRHHLNEHLTLSLPCADEAGQSKWLCFDGDTANGDLFRVEDVLLRLHLNPLREGRRAGKDGHLWLILERTISAKDLNLFGHSILQALQIAPADVELYPRRCSGFGQMRLPLGRHGKPGADVVGLFEGCSSSNVYEQVQWLSNQERSRVEQIENVVRVNSNKISCQEFFISSYDYSPRTFEEVNWHEVLGDWRRQGKEYVRQCPLCELEGRDNHRDNLRTNLDGTKINCVLGGPNAIHKTAELYRFYGFKP